MESNILLIIKSEAINISISASDKSDNKSFMLLVFLSFLFYCISISSLISFKFILSISILTASNFFAPNSEATDNNFSFNLVNCGTANLS